MSTYSYSLLPASGDNIRLLRLLPSEDEVAPLHCELGDYSLRRSTPRTHLYEALSYVWGDPHNTLPIYVDKKHFQVTVNLHAALLHLRDHSFERILWLDAICIDQNNNEERKQQVQLMARIYNSAHRVVVWLGEETAEVKGALEDIQLAANEEPKTLSKENLKWQNILNLLQNPWFQRIWVLQEAAAARHIIIMCGSITIDGYAFCLGVKSLDLPYKDSLRLQTLPSVVEIIERAGLRPKFKVNLSERFSLEIRSLAELLDMFHTRQATDRRDKVYALLGMSSDDPEKAGLQANYESSWEDIFQQLAQFVLGENISIDISGQIPRIKCKGIIIGQIFSVDRDSRQHVYIISDFERRVLGGTNEWTLQASAKPIQKNDIVCLLYGASNPSIIRLCKDHFAVIVIAATPLNVLFHHERPRFSQSETQFLRDFELVWDWESSYGDMQDEKYKTLTKKFGQTSVFSRVEPRGYLEKATRLWNDIAILDDLNELDEADERFIAAQDEYYLAAFGKMPSSYESGSECGRTILAFAAGKGHEDIVKLLLDTTHPDIKDGKGGQTPLFFAAEHRHEAAVELLPTTSQFRVNSKDKSFRTSIITEFSVALSLAIDPSKNNLKPKYFRTPLYYAIKKGNEFIVKLLLATSQIDINLKDTFGQTPLCWAAREGNESVVKLLLSISQVEVNLEDEKGRAPIHWATNEGHESVVKLLLANGQVEANSKDIYGRTPLLTAAKKGYDTIVKLLLATGQVEVNSEDEKGRAPIHWATKGGHEPVVKLLLANGQVEVNSKDIYGRTPLLTAAKKGYDTIVKLLLATGQVEVDSKDDNERTPLDYAIMENHVAVIKLLENYAKDHTTS